MCTSPGALVFYFYTFIAPVGGERPKIYLSANGLPYETGRVVTR